jgi:hypothetical protein
MRFRQAQWRRRAALGATPPLLAVASQPAVLSSVGQAKEEALAKAGWHHIRPQNRRAVVLSVWFCSFYFAADHGSARLGRAVTRLGVAV